MFGGTNKRKVTSVRVNLQGQFIDIQIQQFKCDAIFFKLKMLSNRIVKATNY